MSPFDLLLLSPFGHTVGHMAKLSAEDITQRVATYLRTEAFGRRVTQGMIAEAAGLSRSAVNEYLNGKKEMRLPSFLNICDAIGVSADDVLASVSTGRPGATAPEVALVEGRAL